MDPDTLTRLLEDAVHSANQDSLWLLVVFFMVVAIGGFVSSYIGTYLQAKRRNLATK